MKIILYTVCNIHKESNFLSLAGTLLFINKYNCISLDQMKKNDIFLHLLYPPNTAILAQLCQKCKIYGGKWVLCFISTFEPQSNVQFSLSAQVLYVSHRVLDTCKQIKDEVIQLRIGIRIVCWRGWLMDKSYSIKIGACFCIVKTI